MKLLSWLRKKREVSAPELPVQPRCMSYQCAAMQGIGSRESQEDAWALVNAEDVTGIRREGLLAVVADGMGGLEHGALASRIGIQTISEDFRLFDRSALLERQLAESVLHAAEAVYDRLQGAGGSTVIACMVFDEQLYYAGMGDSYLYLLRQGKLIRINRPQNVLHEHYLERIRQGCMDISEITGVSQPNAITGFLGIDQISELDWLCRAMPLMDGDVLLLCSDGVGAVLLPSEICECISIPNANAAADALQQRIFSKGYTNQDNYTAVVIHCKK